MNGRLALVLTRGDGRNGEDITSKIYRVPVIPIELDTSIDLVIHDEIYMSHDVFEQLKKDTNRYTTPRHVASGLLTADTNNVDHYPLEFKMYNIPIHPYTDITTYHTLIDHVSKVTTIPVANTTYLPSYQIDDLINIREDYIRRRHLIGYDIDGIVIKVDNLSFFRS